MKITISALFTQPGVSFKISHKVIRLIRDVLNKRFGDAFGLGEKEMLLNLTISTKRECKSVEVRGPDFDTRNKCITWALWLPYEEINQSADQVELLVSKFFEAAGMAFSSYGIKLEAVELAKEEVKREMLAHNNYSE